VARLFEAVREGVFIGSVGREGTGGETLAANPCLRAMFGYDAATPDAAIAPLAPDRFADPDDAARPAHCSLRTQSRSQQIVRALNADLGQRDLLYGQSPADAQPIAVEDVARCDQPVQPVERQAGGGRSDHRQRGPKQQRR